MMVYIYNAKVVLETGILFDGAILLDGDRIAAVGERREIAIPEGAEMELVAGFDQGVLNLTSGKVDALATSCSVALQYADQSNGQIAKSTVEFDLSMYGAYEGTVVAAKKGEEDLINVINQILEFVNENAIYDIMYKQALDEAGMIDVQ